jgi:hypothetical protein
MRNLTHQAVEELWNPVLRDSKTSSVDHITFP